MLALMEGELKMGNNYGLSNTEMQIMELLWKTEYPLAFKEIMSVAQNEWGKKWKAQTLNTYLINLQKIKMVGTDRSTTHYLYYALCSKEELVHNWTRQLVRECFDNSISRLFAAFIGNEKLSENEAEELKKLL